MAHTIRPLIRRLIDKFGNECHYCGLMCTKKKNHPRQATKDHVVPRYFGGLNIFENYVLACAQCNSKRGNNLFECGCTFCVPLIQEALDSQDNIDYVFSKMADFNKPRIFKNENSGARKTDGEIYPWIVILGNGRKQFKTFDEALEYGLYKPADRKVVK